MYLAGVSVGRVEDITEALGGTRVSPATVSNLKKKIYANIDVWRNRPITSEHSYRQVPQAAVHGAAAGWPDQRPRHLRADARVAASNRRAM